MKASLLRLLAMAWKEWLHIRRDARTLYIALIMPSVLVLLFGYAVNFDVDRIALGVLDLDGTQASRALTMRLGAGDWFLPHNYLSQAELSDAIEHGQIKIALLIPAGFARRLERGEDQAIGAFVDGSDNNAAAIGVNYLQLFVLDYSRRVTLQRLDRFGVRLQGGIQLTPRILYNPDLRSRHFALPGLIVIALAVIAALLSSLTIAREWERGSMEQLIATPVRPHEIVLGKIVPYAVIAVVQTLAATALATWLFDVPFRGSLLSLLVAATAFAIVTLGIGVMLSAALRAQLPAMQAALMSSLLPALFLSGFVFPIESMPAPPRALSYIVPARHLILVFRTIFLKGEGIDTIWAELLMLALLACAVLLMASRRLKKRVA
ncbi:MAG: ABC transporter permease [Leptospirales bacterium]|nr:ABC transporter permease [Leptospirales bacterium]